MPAAFKDKLLQVGPDSKQQQIGYNGTTFSVGNIERCTYMWLGWDTNVGAFTLQYHTAFP